MRYCKARGKALKWTELNASMAATDAGEVWSGFESRNGAQAPYALRDMVERWLRRLSLPREPAAEG